MSKRRRLFNFSYYTRYFLDTKWNFNINERVTSFLRFSVLDYRTANPTVFGDFGGNRLHRTNSNPGDGFGNTYAGTASLTYVVSPTFVLDGYFGVTRVDTNIEQALLDENVGLDFLEIPGTNGTRRFEGGWPRMRIDGFEQIGITGIDLEEDELLKQAWLPRDEDYARLGASVGTLWYLTLLWYHKLPNLK